MSEKTPTRRRNTLHDIFAAARDERLTHEELRVWLLFRYHDFKDKGTFVGAETIGLEAGMGKRTVERHRAALVKKGFLERKFRGPRPALYKAVVPPKAYADVAEQGDESLRTSTATSDAKHRHIWHPNTGGGNTGEYFSCSNEQPGLCPEGFSLSGEGGVSSLGIAYDALSEDDRALIASWVGDGFPAGAVSPTTVASLTTEQKKTLRLRREARGRKAS